MVAAVEEEVGGVEELVGVEEECNFGGPGAAVNKVAVEEVGVLVGGVAVAVEDLEQIEELACSTLSASIFPSPLFETTYRAYRRKPSISFFLPFSPPASSARP